MDHVRLYNGIRIALKRENFDQVKELAGLLEKELNTYGWDQLPLTGKPDVDDSLKALDRYLTGQR